MVFGIVVEASGVALAVASKTKWHSEMNERLDATERIDAPSPVSRKPEVASLNAFIE
jgi:hypothetical protein